MTAPEFALEHYAARAELTYAAAAATAGLWAQVDPADIVGSWTAQIPEAALVTTGGQLAAARTAQAYVAEAAAFAEASGAAAAAVRAAAFAGVASDARDLISLLYQPVIASLLTIKAGADTRTALTAGRATLDMIVRTQVADAGRLADQAGLAARKDLDGYVRVVVGATCSRCIVLAGKFYRYSTGFDRHPNCLPAGVTVSGPSRLATTRRSYEGELALIETASGKKLPITGNHPVLTCRGWLPANLVQEGDYVVRGSLAEGARPLVVPGENQVPSRVEDLWRSDDVAALLQMPTTAKDFHGDGRNGKVDVVFADRFLRHRVEMSLAQHLAHEPLALRGEFSDRLDRFGVIYQLLDGSVRSTHGAMGSGGLGLALLGGHLAGPGLRGGGPTAHLDSFALEAPPHDIAANPQATCDAVLTFAVPVGLNDFSGREHDFSARWDAPPVPFSMQSRAAYAEIGQDLLLRLAGQVAPDRVVENRRIQWSGHVYNLTSAEGWYSANDLVVSNCDCVHLPTRRAQAAGIKQDPQVIYDSLTPAERRAAGWTLADQKALAEGADLNQVTNARRGLHSAGERRFTTVGTSRRALYGGYDIDPETGQLTKLPRGQKKRAPRLSVDQIFIEAGDDRDKAIRLLRQYGYLVGPA